MNISNLSAAQVWAAWKNQLLTVGQVADWQQQNNYYFDEKGGRAL